MSTPNWLDGHQGYSQLSTSMQKGNLKEKNYYVWREPALSLHSHHVSLVQWTTCLLPVTRDRFKSPVGYLCETGILLLALSRYIGDPDVIDHCGLV